MKSEINIIPTDKEFEKWTMGEWQDKEGLTSGYWDKEFHNERVKTFLWMKEFISNKIKNG